MDRYYQDADDRRLVDIDDEDELPYLEDHLYINEDIELPLFILNGVAYY